jgi:hypothetical protein
MACCWTNFTCNKPQNIGPGYNHWPELSKCFFCVTDFLLLQNLTSKLKISLIILNFSGCIYVCIDAIALLHFEEFLLKSEFSCDQFFASSPGLQLLSCKQLFLLNTSFIYIVYLHNKSKVRNSSFS